MLFPARLLILQSTSFCNIDCEYCYLPDRSKKRRMPLDVVSAAVRFVAEGGLLDSATTVVWHAGEPLTVPVDWYREASRLIADGWGRPYFSQAFQTNGMLINSQWCEYFAETGSRVGVSLDGPPDLHDNRRKRRNGRGTHAETMRGVDLLRKAGVDFHVLCVISQDSLDRADEIVEFFVREDIRNIGFNVEEAEGAHTVSPLFIESSVSRFASFFDRVLDRAASFGGRLTIREVSEVVSALANPNFGRKLTRSEASPFAYVAVATDGGISTFSPELLGQTGRESDPPGFVFGNVTRDSLGKIVKRSVYRRIAEEIENGVSACRRECPYFDFCGGGSPVNKLFELGRFSGTQTYYCRLAKQVVSDVILARLESGAALPI
ncbi:hypothetical protein AMST5_00105 [freshwater sediment metagenome]|uniref:Radical SAM core domain-containing protein n=1 Tax=freshwater sediment metagenome TaxID=556182 RepID=A0AA48LWV7_9ZZZZ